MRLFLAINPPPEVVAHLANLQDSLRPSVHPPVSWTKREQLHVTLKFIGEADEPFAESLRTALTAADLPPAFDLRPTALTLFPPRGPSRIIAAELTPSAPEPLTALHCLLEDTSANLAVPRESRPFRPHITLARLRTPRRIPDRAHSATAPAFPGPSFRVGSVDLMKSTLASSGATYERLWSIPLA